MKTHRASSVLVTVLIATGCAQQGPSHGAGFVAHRAGFVAHMAMVGFSRDSLIKSGSTRKPLEFSDPVETDGIVAFKASANNQAWGKVLLGASMDAQKKKGEGSFLQSSLLFSLRGGWVYIYGDEPQVVTGRVSAGADGSAILVQIDTDANVHRIYFLGGKTPAARATVTALLNQPPSPLPPLKRTLAKNQFVEADKDGNLTTPAPIPAGPIMDFRDEVIKKIDIFFP